MTLRVLLVDDEPLARQALRQLLAAHSDIEIVGECVDGIEAREALAALNPDILLLDIRMPELSGLDVAGKIGARPLVIFVTAHEQFGASAYATGAAEYVLKPVTQERLDLALDRVRRRIAAETDAERFRDLGELASPRQWLDRLLVRVGAREVIVPTGDIDLIMADDVYAAVHAGGRRHLVRTTLDKLEGELDPSRFARVHRSYIVPVDRVVAIRRVGRELTVEMKNGATVPISRRRRANLERLLKTARGGAIRDTNYATRDMDD